MVLVAGLAGCQDKSLTDLEGYTMEVLARPGKRPEALPPLEPYIVYNYASAGDTDPFEPFFVEPPAPPEPEKKAGSGVQPDFDRNREELESHPLDALRMVGTLELDETMWAIVRSPDAVIHRVQAGNYLGRNHGKILHVSEEAVELVEIVQDGQGGWEEREASLALIE